MLLTIAFWGMASLVVVVAGAMMVEEDDSFLRVVVVEGSFHHDDDDDFDASERLVAVVLVVEEEYSLAVLHQRLCPRPEELHRQPYLMLKTSVAVLIVVDAVGIDSSLQNSFD
jgi:hypothetical protein